MDSVKPDIQGFVWYMCGNHDGTWFITKTHLFQYIENFTTKAGNFSDKISNIFFYIPAQNIDCGYTLEPAQDIDCGYTLEPPRRGGFNEYPQSMIF